ncbi:hypothetical protein ABEW05_006252 [Botrytis cinerea]
MVYRAKEADTTTVYPADAIPAIDADEADVYLADKRAKNEDTAIVYHEKERLRACSGRALVFRDIVTQQEVQSQEERR